MSELIHVIERLATSFNKYDIEYALVGAVAGFYFGQMRTTSDIDIIILPSKTEPEKLHQALLDADFDSVLEDLKISLTEKSHFTVFDKKSKYWLDIAFSDGELPEYTIKNVIRGKNEYKNLRLQNIISYLISKLYFMKDILKYNKNEIIKFKDVLDFIQIYRLNTDKINQDELLLKIKDFGLEEIYKKIMEIYNYF